MYLYFLACMQNKIKVLKTIKKLKAKNWKLCKSACDANQNCDFFNWKVIILTEILSTTFEHFFNIYMQPNKRASKRLCYLLSSMFVKKSGWWSGERMCAI